MYCENDEEFRQLSLYVRHNRAQRGHFNIGDEGEDILLMTINGERRSLFSYHQHNDRPFLIIAGSYS